MNGPIDGYMDRWIEGRPAGRQASTQAANR